VGARIVVVAGGAGYIGSHMVRMLREHGYRPVVVDNLATGHAQAAQGALLREGDIGDRDFMASVLHEFKPACVMHFAASSLVGESVQQPGKYWRNNLVHTLSLLDTMVACGVKRFIFSSTAAVYGNPVEVPIPEHHPTRPINPYGHSKLAVEHLLQDYEAAHGLRSVSLRYFNAAGADPGGAIGEAHDPETHLMPLAIDAALGLGKPLSILGTDYDTPDGTCVRDYIHVDDLADAHVRAVGWLADHPGHTAFNLGSGSGYSVREVIEQTSRIVGQPVPHSVGPRRPGDSPKLVGNIARARAVLGWSPTRDLATQIEDALRWWRKMPRT